MAKEEVTDIEALLAQKDPDVDKIVAKIKELITEAGESLVEAKSSREKTDQAIEHLSRLTRR